MSNVQYTVALVLAFTPSVVFLVAFITSVNQRDDADWMLKLIRKTMYSPYELTDTQRLEVIRKILEEGKR